MCQKIYKVSLRKVLVLDKTYVLTDPLDTLKREFYYASDPNKVKYDGKVRHTAKFLKKYLVWVQSKW